MSSNGKNLERFLYIHTAPSLQEAIDMAVSRRMTLAIAVTIVIAAAAAAYYFFLRPKRAGGIIIIGTTDKVTDLDPASAYDFFTWEVLSNIGEGFFKYEPETLELKPALAEDYEVEEGGKVWILKLRKGLKFRDGTELTAEVVKWSIERVARIEGDPAWFVLDFVDKVEVVDKYTVKIVLQKPVAFYKAVLAVPTYFPISPKSYSADKIDPDNTAGGIGPYRIVRFVRDQEIVLEANPDYYGDKPKTKKIIIKFYKDATALRMALEAGEIDIAWRTLNPSDIIDLKEGGKFKVIEGKGAFIRYIVLNTNVPPLNDKRVRQALAAALDRKKISEEIFMGTVTPLYSLVPAGMWAHIDAFKDKYGEGPDLELARKLLREAGYSEENKLKIELWYTPTHYGSTEADLAAAIKECWEATGMIEVTIKSAEWSTYLELTRKKGLPVTLYGWYPDYLDPDNFLYPFLHTGSNRWLGNPYSNPELDKMLDKAQAATDTATREKLYTEVQKILAEDSPIIPIFQGKLYVVTKPEIEGVVIDPYMLLRYWLIYKG